MADPVSNMEGTFSATDFTNYQANMLFHLDNLSKFARSVSYYQTDPNPQHLLCLAETARDEQGLRRAAELSETLRLLVKDQLMEHQPVRAQEFAETIEGIAAMMNPQWEHYKHYMQYIEDARHVIKHNERISPSLLNQLNERDQYTTNLGTPTTLKEILHAAVGNACIPIGWAAKYPEGQTNLIREIEARAENFMPNATAEERRDRASEWLWIEQSMLPASDDFPPKKQTVAHMLLDVYQMNQGHDFYREHLRGVAKTLELGLESALDAIDKETTQKATDTLRKTSEQGYQDMPRSNENRGRM